MFMDIFLNMQEIVRQSFNYFRCLLASHSLHTLRIWSCPVQRANIPLSFCSVFSHDEKNSAVMKNVDRHHPQWCRNDDPCRELFSKRGEKYSGEWVHLGNLAYTVAWCKCTMMHHSEDCTDGASSWTVGACRLHQSVTGVSGSVVWGGLHKEAGVIASALISCQDTHLLWICIYTQ